VHKHRSKAGWFRLSTLAALVLAALAFAACGSSDDDSSDSASTTSTEPGTSSVAPIQRNPENEGKPPITIGSKNFTEQYILGNIYAQALEAAGYRTITELNLGSEQIALRALKSGQVDAYPEYTGTALTSFFGFKTEDVPKDPSEAYDETKAGFAKDGLTALDPTPFTNSNAVGMLRERAEELGVTTISDLSGKSEDLTLAGSPECRQRPDCLLGLEGEPYNLKFKKFIPVEIAQRYAVLDNGQADLSIVFTTDGQLASDKYVVLEDDKRLFPPYNATLVVRDETMKSAGSDLPDTINRIQADLTEDVMRELNSRVDLDKEEPQAVAKQYLQEAGYIAE
jgi:glycine betaine/choline ABC-type transport system substrate-binding protein